jgi:FkbM family methyltransferase
MQINTWNLFNEELRYNYPLNRNSLVVDIGGYKGDFASEILSRYNCQIIIYEPVKKFYDEIVERFKFNRHLVSVNHCAISGKDFQDYKTKVIVDNESSSLIEDFSGIDKPIEEVHVLNNQDTIGCLGEIDLLKINIEGGEYDVLPVCDFTKIKNIQIQFHSFVPDAFKMRDEIRKKLSLTHYVTYSFDWIWENWRRKDQPFDNYKYIVYTISEAYEKELIKNNLLEVNQRNFNQTINNLIHKYEVEISNLKTEMSNLIHEYEVKLINLKEELRNK